MGRKFPGGAMLGQKLWVKVSLFTQRFSDTEHGVELQQTNNICQNRWRACNASGVHSMDDLQRGKKEQKMCENKLRRKNMIRVHWERQIVTEYSLSAFAFPWPPFLPTFYPPLYHSFFSAPVPPSLSSPCVHFDRLQIHLLDILHSARSCLCCFFTVESSKHFLLEIFHTNTDK